MSSSPARPVVTASPTNLLPVHAANTSDSGRTDAARPSLGAVSDLIIESAPLRDGAWPTVDPFLFCAYHRDDYPRGNGALGPAEPLTGRDLGMDFSRKDGWSMYHGKTIPGFPQHPHRGFETVTIARRGLVDHADSLGATARYGNGDVQWLTAGSGIVHSEMFPLLESGAPNPLDLFQIWLNLPAADKMVDPYFSMQWATTMPVIDSGGVLVTVVAGPCRFSRVWWVPEGW